MGGVGVVDISSEEEVRSRIGGVGLGMGQVVLVVSLWVVGGHVGAQLQAGLDERVHGSHAACGFPPLLPAHLTVHHPCQALPRPSHALAGVSQTLNRPWKNRISFYLSQCLVSVQTNY